MVRHKRSASGQSPTRQNGAHESPEHDPHASSAHEAHAARGVCVRSLVGVSARSAADGPAYTLSPEPMTSTPIVDAQGRPRSVWSAILRMSGSSYAEAVRALWPHVGKHDPDLVLADSLLFEAVRTRAFEALPSGAGWRVWIDKGRKASVEVVP